MYRKFLKFIENIFYMISIVLAVVFMFLCIWAIYINIHDLKVAADNIMAIAAVFTVNSAIATFIHNIKIKRQDRARKLYEDFENSDYREARRLARNIREVYKQGEITPVILEKLINNIQDDERVIDLRNRANLTVDEQGKLLESLIFLFNYWEQIYFEIIQGTSDENYLMEQLSGVFVSQYERFNFWMKKFIRENCPEQYRHLTDFYLYTKKYLVNENLTLSQKINKWWRGL